MWVGAVAKLPLILCRHCCLCMNNSHSGKNVVLSKWCGRLLVFSVHAQIAGYVNQPMVDVSILQRSLAILESMVLNSHSLYHRVAQEITVGQLIGHLQVWAHTHAQGRHALWWTEEQTSFCWGKTNSALNIGTPSELMIDELINADCPFAFHNGVGPRKKNSVWCHFAFVTTVGGFQKHASRFKSLLVLFKTVNMIVYPLVWALAALKVQVSCWPVVWRSRGTMLLTGCSVA